MENVIKAVLIPSGTYMFIWWLYTNSLKKYISRQWATHFRNVLSLTTRSYMTRVRSFFLETKCSSCMSRYLFSFGNHGLHILSLRYREADIGLGSSPATLQPGLQWNTISIVKILLQIWSRYPNVWKRLQVDTGPGSNVNPIVAIEL